MGKQEPSPPRRVAQRCPANLDLGSSVTSNVYAESCLQLPSLRTYRCSLLDSSRSEARTDARETVEGRGIRISDASYPVGHHQEFLPLDCADSCQSTMCNAQAAGIVPTRRCQSTDCGTRRSRRPLLAQKLLLKPTKSRRLSDEYRREPIGGLTCERRLREGQFAVNRSPSESRSQASR